ncbi:MAG: IS5/IS1182 family transposase, partial [Janthinobacterium lividum]
AGVVADKGRFFIHAKRWVVERSTAWAGNNRRLAIDYEFTPRSHETWLLIANLTMGLNRLTQT